MTAQNELIQRAYAAFNDRDIDAALELMTESVVWPKASEGGNVVGKDEIRAYWTRQWQEFDPTVQPVELQETSSRSVRVRVHQIVNALNGDLLADCEVIHRYTFEDGLISKMTLGDGESSTNEPASAFQRRD